ncbi:hypothetical protein [Gulosibacter macacae]|uniref:hypothetical protein n=1 Tax=Gulosibacter macacae TaxID=2488791 RepID=UPI00163B1D06|nr:hypothetical protein [Gulosibacter macacae]
MSKRAILAGLVVAGAFALAIAQAWVAPAAAFGGILIVAGGITAAALILSSGAEA